MTGSKRILILGGTGFLGPAVVRAARARGHQVTLFNRGRTNAELFPDVARLRGDRDGDLKALDDGRWDSVIDPSGYVPRIVRMSAERLSERVGQYVFISSISVYGDMGIPEIDEDSPVAKIEDETNEEVRANYGALKALCEQAAEQVMPGRVACVRPGLIVGPGDPTDRFTYWPVRVARGGRVLAPGSGDDPIQIVDVRDLAAWLVRVVEEELTGVFNATGPKGRLTMRELLETCREEVDRDARFVWVDAAFLDEMRVAPWSDMPVWVPADGETGAITRVRVERAVAAGLDFRPLLETCRDTRAWFETLPADRRETLRAGLTAERETEVLEALRARTA